jgi:hypothetical protein
MSKEGARGDEEKVDVTFEAEADDLAEVEEEEKGYFFFFFAFLLSCSAVSLVHRPSSIQSAGCYTDIFFYVKYCFLLL